MSETKCYDDRRNSIRGHGHSGTKVREIQEYSGVAVLDECRQHNNKTIKSNI